MRFHKILQEYEDILIVRNCAKNTIKSNKRIITRFWRFINAGNITSFDHVTLKVMINYTDYLMKSEKNCHAYVYGQMNVIRGFFRFLYAHKYIKSNEISGYSYVRPKKDLPKDIPTQEELYNIFSEIELGIKDRAILELYYGTGMRLSELINLNTDDIDFNNNLIFIKEGKGKKDRIVPVTDHVLGLIRDYLSSVEVDLRLAKPKPLFLSSTGNRMTETVIGRIFKKLRDSSNLNKKLSSHILRHCFATHMLKNGANVRDIQEILGHEDLGTTQRYTKVEISDLKRVIKRFHPRENEIYSDEDIILPRDQFFTRRKGCKRNRKKIEY